MTRHEIDCKQGSAEWHRCRLAIPTASNTAAIVTPTGTATANSDRRRYRNAKLEERMTGQIHSNYVSAAMERGKLLEPQALAWYQIETDRPIKPVGFVQCSGEGWMFGASPDGMAADRGVEVKVPMLDNLIEIYIEDKLPWEYIAQCQGGMWATGVPRWDLVLFSGVSGIPNRIYELRADEKLFAAFDKEIPAFCKELNAATAKLVAMGGRERWLEPHENGADIMGDA